MTDPALHHPAQTLPAATIRAGTDRRDHHVDACLFERPQDCRRRALALPLMFEALSESEAANALDYITSRQHRELSELLESAPPDDEPTTPGEEAAVQVARQELARGETISLDEIRAQLGAEWRLRAGDWRVRFTREHATHTVNVLRVLPRRRAYRD